jgi:Ca2+-binding RTX toxin-like protein
VTWNFGDGSPAVTSNLGAGVTGAVSATHAFIAAGPQTVTLTITDKDGGSAVVTKVFTVDVVDIQPDPANPALTALFVGGTPGNDNITINPGSNPGDQAIVNCSVYSNLVFTGRIVVYGGDGNDTIQVAGGLTNPTELYGGNGDDQIKGDNGNNIIVGGAGNDVLVGGNNRDVLIGGGGSDSLVGGAGDDVLVAMATSYDSNPAALESIMNEWNRADETFSQRVGHLVNGGGLNGSNVLNDSTTFNDNSTDVLTGCAGSDAFFISDGDIVTDAGKSDAVVDLSWVTV